jgi:Trk-type K+ transport system membrane component
MALLDANAMPFQRNIPIPLVLALLILAGNTAFPVFLRFIIWSLLQVLNLVTGPFTLFAWKEALEFILKYPRRVYTNLFPVRQTWWLVFMLILTNAVDAGAFVIMNIGNPTTEAIPLGNRIVDGIFQATGKFSLSLSLLSTHTIG